MTMQPQRDTAPRVEERCWGLPEDVSLLWRSWDEEVIVFNRASGQTHLLDALSAEVLKQLERHPASLDELRSHFAGRYGVESEKLGERLAEICRTFDQVGLAELVDR